MKIGERGLALIKRWEGLRLTPYRDSAGHLTIGFGHMILPGETFVRLEDGEAEALLGRDLAKTERVVTKLVPACRQSEFDAFVSFAFNLGAYALQQSTLMKLHKAGDRLNAAIQFTAWHHAGVKPLRGLLRRRLEEASLYLEDP